MPFTPILIIEIFDCWGFRLCGAFPPLMWVPLHFIPTRTHDHKVVSKILKEHIFSRFGMPREIISDGGLHFCNRPFENLLKKY